VNVARPGGATREQTDADTDLFRVCTGICFHTVNTFLALLRLINLENVETEDSTWKSVFRALKSQMSEKGRAQNAGLPYTVLKQDLMKQGQLREGEPLSLRGGLLTYDLSSRGIPSSPPTDLIQYLMRLVGLVLFIVVPIYALREQVVSTLAYSNGSRNTGADSSALICHDSCCC
jgi:hypothetical protein